jgi:hypothetical protein
MELFITPGAFTVGWIKKVAAATPDFQVANTFSELKTYYPLMWMIKGDNFLGANCFLDQRQSTRGEPFAVSTSRAESSIIWLLCAALLSLYVLYYTVYTACTDAGRRSGESFITITSAFENIKTSLSSTCCCSGVLYYYTAAAAAWFPWF